MALLNGIILLILKYEKIQDMYFVRNLLWSTSMKLFKVEGQNRCTENRPLPAVVLDMFTKFGCPVTEVVSA